MGELEDGAGEEQLRDLGLPSLEKLEAEEETWRCPGSSPGVPMKKAQEQQLRRVPCWGQLQAAAAQLFDLKG